ncbi:tetratricopeptide repeat protein [Kaarinaea lacus]
MYKMKLVTGLLFTLAALSGNAFAESSNETMQAVEKLQHRWEEIKFNMAKDQQEGAFDKLAKEAHIVSEKYPDQAEPLIWEAIIESSYAGAKGGLGALSLVKDARELLIKAEKINPNALNGSVYASLGNLYYRVPGWPIGFGNDEKARSYLEKALQINPDGIEPNFFYGEFLYEEGDYEKALQVLNKALEAPARKGREISDNGQRKEIAAIIENVKRQL